MISGYDEPSTHNPVNKLDNAYSKYNHSSEKSKVNLNNILDTDIQNNPLLKIIGTKKIFNWLGIPTKFDEIYTYAKWWKFYDNVITFSNLIRKSR